MPILSGTIVHPPPLLPEYLSHRQAPKRVEGNATIQLATASNIEPTRSHGYNGMVHITPAVVGGITSQGWSQTAWIGEGVSRS